jgi:hypothetical protein
VSNGAQRDIALPDDAPVGEARRGKRYVAAIGIDAYGGDAPARTEGAWGRLKNAVSDATGAMKAFGAVGFDPIGLPLENAAATGVAIIDFIRLELGRRLGDDDSLVLFFAGHGHTESDTEGFVIPVDAKRDSPGTWLPVDTLLRAVNGLRARHILVILDCCESGAALLGAPKRPYLRRSIPILEHRRSRLVIASARQGQKAADHGPVSGHSLFTGHLVEALKVGAVPGSTILAADLASEVARRVGRASKDLQTPDFEPFGDDRDGDLVIHVPDTEGALEAHVAALLHRARAADDERVAAFCQQTLEGHDDDWRAIDVVRWGEYRDGTGSHPRVARDPRRLSADEFDELSRDMKREPWLVTWSLEKIRAWLADNDGAAVFISEENERLFYSRRALQGLLDKIRDMLPTP